MPPVTIAFDLFGVQLSIVVDANALWLALGLAAQFVFMMRFIVQWIATERAKRSVVPTAFWYISIVGGALLLIYAIHVGDPVFIIGQSTGLFIYLRNLYFLTRERRRLAEMAATEAAVAINPDCEDDEKPEPARALGLSRTAFGVLGFLSLLTLYRVIVLFVAPHPLFGDEAQYWSWSLDLTAGYYSKPPVVAWAIAGTTAVCGAVEGCVRLAAPLAWLIGALAVFALARRQFDERTGRWSTAVFATLPGVMVSSGVISTDPFLLMFWAIALFGLWRALEEDGFAWWVVTGVAIGLGLMSKYTMVAFIGSALLFMALDRESRPKLRRPHIWLALLVALAVFSPNILWNADNGFPSFLHVAENAHLGGRLLRPVKMLAFFGNQFLVFGPMLFAALLYFLAARCALWIKDRRLLFLLSFVWPLLLTMLAQSLLSRAHPNWAAPVYISASVFVTVLLLKVRWREVLFISITLHLFVGAVLYHYDAITDGLGLERSKGNDPYARLRGWDEMGERVAGLLERHPQARLLLDDRMVLAPMLFYAGPRAADAVKWNGDFDIDDHYDLTRDAAQAAGETLLFVTPNVNLRFIDPHADRITLLQEIRIPVVENLTLRYDAYLVEGFRGYRN